MAQVVKLGCEARPSPRGERKTSPADAADPRPKRKRRTVTLLVALITLCGGIVLYSAAPHPSGEAPASGPADAVANGPKEVLDEPDAKERVRRPQQGEVLDEPPASARRG